MIYTIYQYVLTTLSIRARTLRLHLQLGHSVSTHHTVPSCSRSRLQARLSLSLTDTVNTVTERVTGFYVLAALLTVIHVLHLLTVQNTDTIYCYSCTVLVTPFSSRWLLLRTYVADHHPLTHTP